MFLRKTRRHKDGKTHEYYSVVENPRVAGGRHIQYTLLYLGEISDGQKKSWNRAIDVVEGDRTKQMSLFPEGIEPEQRAGATANVRLDKLELERPRQWGAWWLACELWETLGLRSFWHERLGTGYRGVHWERVLLLLSAYRLIDPGSEWQLHRIWFEKSAMGDLLGEGFRIAGKDRLYRCQDWLLDYKDDLGQLREASRRMRRDNLLLKVGGLKKEAGRAYHHLKITLPKAGEAITPETFHWKLDMDKYRKTWRGEGCYLLRTNLPVDNAGSTWEHYLRLTEIEEAFRNLKGDLAVRPVHHSAQPRIEAHIFVSFLAYLPACDPPDEV
jgi:hypothetical protein